MVEVIRFYDLFGGIGGFRLGFEKANQLVEGTTSAEPKEASEVFEGKRGRGQCSDGCREVGFDSQPGPRDEEGQGKPFAEGRGRRFKQELRGSIPQSASGKSEEGRNGVVDEQETRLYGGRNPAFNCVGYCDWDKFAVECYNENFNESHEPTDATKINATKLPDFDLLCAGFPCQSFSLAGKRKGFQDIRGTLFYEIVRIAQEKKPRLLLLENVKGLLSNDSGRSFYAVLVSLAKLGYRLEWEVLNSKNFGVPQNRERVFVVGCLGDGSGRQVFPLGQGVEVFGKGSVKGQKGEVCGALQADYYKRPRSVTYVQEGGEGKRIQGENSIMNVPHGFNEGWVKKYPNLRAEGDSAHNELLIFDARNKKFVDNSPSLLSGGLSHFSNFSPIVVSKQKKIRRLTPVECERLQGFPDGWTKMLSDTQRYKVLGNAVTTNVVQAIGEKLLDQGLRKRGVRV